LAPVLFFGQPVADFGKQLDYFFVLLYVLARKVEHAPAETVMTAVGMRSLLAGRRAFWFFFGHRAGLLKTKSGWPG
jgi:hypothetical protein